jgi:hypothetical protein
MSHSNFIDMVSNYFKVFEGKAKAYAKFENIRLYSNYFKVFACKARR